MAVNQSLSLYRTLARASALQAGLLGTSPAHLGQVPGHNAHAPCNGVPTTR